MRFDLNKPSRRPTTLTNHRVKPMFWPSVLPVVPSLMPSVYHALERVPVSNVGGSWLGPGGRRNEKGRAREGLDEEGEPSDDRDASTGAARALPLDETRLSTLDSRLPSSSG